MNTFHNTFSSSLSLKTRLFLTLAIITPVLLIQLPAIERPYLGHFASYQGAIMGGIAQNMMREDFSELLLPKTNLVFGSERSLHLNQYPFPSLFVAWGIHFFGGTLEFWGRFQAIAFNLITMGFIGLIGKRLFDERIGWQSATVFAFSPFSLIYGQSFMSEAMALCFLTAALYLVLTLDEPGGAFVKTIVAAFLFSISVTNRLHFAMFYLVFSYCVVTRGNNRPWLRWFIFSFFGFLIPTAWYAYTYFVGLKVAYLHTNAFVQLSMIGKTAPISALTNLDYHKRVLDIISLNMLTPMLFPFFLIGLFTLPLKAHVTRILYLGLVTGVALVILIPQKLIEHDFYLYGAFPFFVFFTSFGLRRLWKSFDPSLPRWIVPVFFLIYLGVSSRYFIHPLFKYPIQATHVIDIAKKIRSITRPDDALIIAGASAPELTFYANRPARLLNFTEVGAELPPFMKNFRLSRVSPNYVEKLEGAMKSAVNWMEFLHREGASFFVSTDKETVDQIPELITHLKKKYEELSRKEDTYYLFRLD